MENLIIYLNPNSTEFTVPTQLKSLSLALSNSYARQEVLKSGHLKFCYVPSPCHCQPVHET